MNHDWTLGRVVGIDIAEVKTLRHVEVELNCSELMIPLQGICNLKVNLWTIESAISWISLIRPSEFIERGFERTFRLIPELIRSHTLFWASRKKNFHIRKIEKLIGPKNHFRDAFDFFFDLRRHA